MSNLKNNSSLLLGLGLLLIAYAYFGFTGHFGYDDVHYANLAENALSGKLDYRDHYSFRWPTIYLTALSYWLFGLEEWSSMLPALLISLLGGGLLIKATKAKGLFTQTLSLVFCFSNPIILMYSHRLMPDIYMGVFVLLAFFILYRQYYLREQTLVNASLFSGSLLLGLLTKGTIVLIAPVLAYMFVLALLQKRQLHFWGYSIGVGILLLGLYLTRIYLITGDILGRLQAIKANSYVNSCSYDLQDFSFTVKRIGYQFWQLCEQNGFFIPFAFVFAGFTKNTLALRSAKDFWLSISIGLLLSANFMTISPSSYVPMCLDARHFLFLPFCAAIAASYSLQELDKQQRRISGLLLTLLLGWNYYRLGFSMSLLPYLGLIVAIIFQGKNKRIALLCISVGLLLPLLPNIRYAQSVDYFAKRQWIEENLLDSIQEKSYILSDPVQVNIGKLWMGFDTNKLPEFISYENYNALKKQNKAVYFIKNTHTHFLSGSAPYPEYYTTNAQLIKERRGLSLFRLPQVKDWQLIAQYQQDFEQEVNAPWRVNPEQLQSDLAYQGQGLLLGGEYSSGLNLNLEAIRPKFNKFLKFRFEFYFNINQTTEASAVISINDFFWKGYPVQKSFRAFNNWTHCSFETSIPVSELKGGQNHMLSAYLWNPKGEKIYMDNLRVEIFTAD